MSDFDDSGDDGDDFGEDGFMGEEPFDDDLSGEDPFQDEPDGPIPDGPGGLGWEEVAFLGAMSEEIAEERKRRAELLREMEKDEDERDREGF